MGAQKSQAEKSGVRSDDGIRGSISLQNRIRTERDPWAVWYSGIIARRLNELQASRLNSVRAGAKPRTRVPESLSQRP